MIGGQSNFFQALGWAVLSSLWQMAFLWVIFQIVIAIFRKTSSANKSALASGLVFAGFGWFVYTLVSALTAESAANAVMSSVLNDAGANDSVNGWLGKMLPIASSIYLLLLIVPLFTYLRNYRYVQTIRAERLSKVDVEWRIFVRNVAARLGIRKPVHVWLSGIVTSPVTIGYVKPVILLPLAAINNLSERQIEAILLHELAHIRRYDYLINLGIRLIQSLLYFNPFVKGLVKTIEREREKSCDEMVIQFQYDAYGYASALLTLEKTNHIPKSLAVAASGQKNDLLHRIEYMLGIQKKQVFSFNKLAGVFAGLLCFIALNALLIISKPSESTNAMATLTHLSSPFYFFTDDDKQINEPVTAKIERSSGSVENHIQPATKDEVNIDPADRIDASAMAFTTAASPFMNVAFTEMPPLTVLKNYQEAQVQETVEACKKVLEEKQWKAVENKIADAMTQHEKAFVKNEYEKALSQVDWKNMENKLRVAYDKINWGEVNDALNKAIVEIKIDSLQHVYSLAMNELTSLQKQLAENNVKSIPDTDISLKAVEERRKSVQTAISTLNKVKEKKDYTPVGM